MKSLQLGSEERGLAQRLSPDRLIRAETHAVGSGGAHVHRDSLSYGHVLP